MYHITNNPDDVREQYKDSANLDARIALHQRFGTDSYPFQRWIFDRFDLPANARILELGCGPASLWRENLDRIPAGWQITLSDMSAGMIAEAQKKLEGSEHSFAFQVLDAQAIPFPDATFDAVIANHMLYHVPDLPKALAEIQRVLKPGGKLYAATNGIGHLRKIKELVKQVTATDVVPELDFKLDNAEALLTPYFAHVAIYEKAGKLVVTETEPLIAYILSGTSLAPDQVERLRGIINSDIARDGAIVITPRTGLCIAQK